MLLLQLNPTLQIPTLYNVDYMYILQKMVGMLIQTFLRFYRVQTGLDKILLNENLVTLETAIKQT